MGVRDKFIVGYLWFYPEPIVMKLIALSAALNNPFSIHPSISSFPSLIPPHAILASSRAEDLNTTGMHNRYLRHLIIWEYPPVLYMPYKMLSSETISVKKAATAYLLARRA